MTAQRILLLLGALLVLGLVLGLLYALRADNPPPPTVDKPRPRTVSAADAPSAPLAPAPRPLVVPDAGTAAATDLRPTPSEPEETMDAEGRIVRDHRGTAANPIPRPFVPGTIAGARQALLDSVKACVPATLPARDAPLRLTVHSTMRVRAGRITATDISMDGTGPLGPDHADCVKRAFTTLDAQTPADQPDAEERVHMPFTVP